MPQSRSLARFGFAAALLLAVAARGAAVPWLYDVEAPVASPAQADRDAAARNALRTMLTRLTGLREVQPAGPVADALREPERYYRQYRFVFDADETWLAVKFAPVALRDLVARAALPVWGADRPTALAWIVVEDAAAQRAAVELARGNAAAATARPPARVVLASGSNHPLAAGIAQRMRARGIEIRLPLMDLDDRARVSAATIWHRYGYTIREASWRYRPDYVILGRARRSASDAWQADWQIWLKDRQLDFQSEAEDAAATAAAAVDAAADALMQRYAVSGTETRAVHLQVRGANAVAAYAAMLQHLASLAFVDDVAVLSATPDTLALRIATRSSRQQLGDLLVGDSAFERMPDAAGAAAADDAPLRLIWRAGQREREAAAAADGAALQAALRIVPR